MALHLCFVASTGRLKLVLLSAVFRGDKAIVWLGFDEIHLMVLRTAVTVSIYHVTSCKKNFKEDRVVLGKLPLDFLSMISVSLSDKCPLVPALQGEENEMRKERKAEEGEKSDPRNANSPTCTPVSKLHIQHSVLT